MKTLACTLALVLLLLFMPRPAGAQTYETLFADNPGRKPNSPLVKGSDGNFYCTTREGGDAGLGTVFKVTPSGELRTLSSFNHANGRNPSGGLVEGSDGNFYGTTAFGGATDDGTVFKVTPLGVITTLVSFNYTDGGTPYAKLVIGSDGNYYGTTSGGGTSNYGTVFKMTPAGVLTTLASFTETSGRFPYAGLVEGGDGNFYGTTFGGGAGAQGTVFKVTLSGTLTTLVNFNNSNGANPQAGLVAGPGGNFYGTTQQGGANGNGTVFKVTPAGALTTLVNFNTTNGSLPVAGLARGSDGNLYGATPSGGTDDYGTVFKVTPTGVLTTLVNFNNANGSGVASLTAGGDGHFYGATAGGGARDFGTVFKVTPAGALTTIASFHYSKGSAPSGLVAGSDGSYYGTTVGGGAASYGTVFKVTPGGVLTTLVSFSGTNGRYPYAGLTGGSDGNFYGTTSEGGVGNLGTVFKVTPGGALTTLASFNGTNGSFPHARLTGGSDGNFYGTTSIGGADDLGTVFKVTPGGALTTLVSFNGTKGSSPYAGLAVGSDGNFYGTTQFGGVGDMGTVFKVTTGGTLTTLVSFTGGNGSIPFAPLVRHSDGNFYGTTSGGGSSEQGTVFKVTPTGALTTLVSFTGNNGALPYSGLAFGSDGNFYGATQYGGVGSYGTVFKMTPAGALTTLHSFNGVTNGTPAGTPVSGSDGNIYGTAYAMVIWRIDSTTLPPTLTAPAANTFINSTVNVAFSLPEAAQPGSVTLTFAGPITRVLTLAASQEAAGAHSFSFDAGAPAAAPAVESGLPLEVDGTYSVTLSYRDALGNPAATTAAANVTLDTQPPVVGGDFSPTYIPAGTPLPDYRGQATGDAVSYTQSPAPGTPTTEGTVTVFLEGRDAAGNVGSRYFYVGVLAAAPKQTVLASRGAAMPGAGRVGSGIPAGAVWSTFGVPSVNELRHAAVLAIYKVGAVSTQAILVFDLADVAGTIRVVAKKGGAAPGRSNVVLGTLRDPLFETNGTILWQAALANAPGTSGAIDATNNIALFLAQHAINGGGSFAVAQKGQEAAGNAVWKTFHSVALGFNSVAFTASMTTDVTTANDSGLWVYNGAMILALREGDAMLGSTIRSISALTARPGSAGQGMGTTWDGFHDFTTARVRLADGRQVICRIRDDGAVTTPHATGMDAPSYGAGAQWQSFGAPTQCEYSAALAFLGVVKAGTGSATSANNVGIFAAPRETPAEVLRIAFKGEAAPGVSGGSFGVLREPVAGFFSTAFPATLKSVAGEITAANNDGIWLSGSTGLRLVAREGAQPPEAPEGAQWKAFNSLALPSIRGPMFVATMHSKTGSVAPGPGAITTANDVGLWATDFFGNLRLLLREGDAIGSSTVRNYTVLSNVPGSPAQARYNDNGNVIVRVTDASNAQHLVLIAVP